MGVSSKCRVRCAHADEAAMLDYRRSLTPGATYFFTISTYRRQRLLTNGELLTALRAGSGRIPLSHRCHGRPARSFPCLMDITVQRCGLFDSDGHAQALRVPTGTASDRGAAGRLQAEAARAWALTTAVLGASDPRRRRLCASYIDYVHYNPVKHGLVRRVREWLHSMFHRFVGSGPVPA